MLAPEFYTPERWHLWLICEVLQALYERRLTKLLFWDLCHSNNVPVWYSETVDWERLLDGMIYTRLMQNISPRFGKSRTLTNFCDWILGKSNKNKIITVSYNTDLASDMSRYVRDCIMMKKNTPQEIVYADIFPNTRIAKGNSSFMKWSLENSYFNYLGAGLEGTITGKGGNCTIIDDPIKNAVESYNDRVLQGIWDWYTGTFLSRSEKEGDGSIDIINHTRWNTLDLCGRVMDSKMGHKWLKLSIPVEYNGELTCPSILPREDFEDLRDNMDTNIFRANYYQEPIDVKGRLFETIKTYESLPENTERIIGYCDTADEGSDFLCCIVGAVKEGEGYITDILYTQDNMTVTEPQTAEMLVRSDCADCLIESNNGGKGFARSVEKIIWEKFKTRKVNIKWRHTSENKMARILTGATFVMQHIYFPEKWANRWPDFYTHVMGFQKAGKNEHDDGVETLVEFGKRISGDGNFAGLIEYMKQLKGKTSH